MYRSSADGSMHVIFFGLNLSNQGILLPLKEKFSPSYAGAVSLFINDTLKFSQFKKNITVFGHTLYKKKNNFTQFRKGS